jgi:serine/threonine protein phosphatase PrpC
MMKLNACGLSDVGRSRSHNEDSMRIDPDRGLFVVADGMGGHGHGDVASRVAIEAIVDYMAGAFDRWGDGQELDRSGARQEAVELEYSIHAAHRSVVEAVVEDETLAGMGTTVVGLVAGADAVAVAHVGDSRVYRLRDGSLELMTEDHTWVYEQVKAGYLSPEQARSHPLKSVVTRAVGGDHQVEVDVRELPVGPGDIFLMCSDGLTTMLTDGEIQSLLMGEGDLEDHCHQLVHLANEKGGVDNITVILLEVVPNDPAAERGS